MKIQYLIILIWIYLPLTSYSQTVYQDISNKGIYNFLDELANEQIITINSSIKPYPRKLIAEKLHEASKKDSLLNVRQEKKFTSISAITIKNYLPENSTINVLTYYILAIPYLRFHLTVFLVDRGGQMKME